MTSALGAAAIDEAVRAYDGQPLGVRFHVRARAWSCPFDAIETRTPPHGRVLDVGCGHGVLSLALAIASPRRMVTGLDIDAGKVRFGAAAGKRAGAGNLGFRVVEPGWQPDGDWDAIVVADVLYLMGRAQALALLGQLSAALAPGGVLLVKEIDVRPRWKYQLARTQELVATKVARITAGAGVDFVPPDDIAAALSAQGLDVEHVSLQRGRMHPHHLVVGRRQ